jgi:hypothetical protein
MVLIVTANLAEFLKRGFRFRFRMRIHEYPYMGTLSWDLEK